MDFERRNVSPVGCKVAREGEFSDSFADKSSCDGIMSACEGIMWSYEGIFSVCLTTKISPVPLHLRARKTGP
ncbi:hypothetical protein AB685_09235 [Bacillus sp. LL01]|nr:hypothetical protein AB685_09235 [Bacillus sp. LL01]